MMIIVRFKGGLGNQMFQYALGRSLQELHQQELLLDANGLSDPGSNLTPRAYELDIFKNIKEKLLSPNQTKAILRSVPFFVWYEEGRFGFHEALLQHLGFPGIGLDGCWQSERYFKAISHLIRKDFTFSDNLNGNSTVCSLRAAESVCIHVRRQDYLTEVGAHIGFVGLEYYRRAVERMTLEVKDPTFFIFSDDIDWCHDNLHLPYSHRFVQDEIGRRAGEYLNIMRQCKHFIIANSSFSWWAAWLSSSEGKRIIAPRFWFSRERFAAGKQVRCFQSSDDIVPDQWIRI